MRWGIFWKALGFGICRNTITLDGALRLHNFIVNCKERDNEGSIDQDINMFDDKCIDFMTANPGEIIGKYQFSSYYGRDGIFSRTLHSNT